MTIDNQAEALARECLDDALSDLDDHFFDEKIRIVDRQVPILAQCIKDAILQFLLELEAHRRDVEARVAPEEPTR